MNKNLRYEKLNKGVQLLVEALKEYHPDMTPQDTTDGMAAAFMIDLVGEISNELSEVVDPKTKAMLMSVMSHEARHSVTNEEFEHYVPKEIQYPSGQVPRTLPLSTFSMKCTLDGKRHPFMMIGEFATREHMKALLFDEIMDPTDYDLRTLKFHDQFRIPTSKLPIIDMLEYLYEDLVVSEVKNVDQSEVKLYTLFPLKPTNAIIEKTFVVKLYDNRVLFMGQEVKVVAVDEHEATKKALAIYPAYDVVGVAEVRSLS